MRRRFRLDPPLVLPLAPTDRERLLYADTSNRRLSLFQVVAWVCLSMSLILFSLNSLWLIPFTIWVGLGLCYFGLSFLANTSYRRFDVAQHDHGVASFRAEAQPSVDIFLPNCGEPLEVLENTFRHVAALEHEGELNVFCLDDAGRREVEELAGRFGFRYLSRPNKGEFKKAGNLRHGYLNSSGDFIAVFDADFCPRADFLAELLPYMDDPSTAIVQSPQYFEVHPDKNWLENGAAATQEFFYRWCMPARDARRSPLCVGTNAVYRRSALVETDGGALVENSEDVHTGFDLMCKGYRTKYVPVIVAKGLCPETMLSFFNQQHRWCSGSMSLLFSRKFWHERIGLRPRLTFLSGMAYYLYTGLAAIVPDAVYWWNYALLVPSLLQSYLFLPRWHRAPYGAAVMRTKLVYSWAHLFAFWDRLAGRKLHWRATGGGDHGKNVRIRVLRVLLVAWPLGVVAAIGAGSAAHMSSPFDLDYWPALLLAGVYLSASVATLEPLRPKRQAATPGPAGQVAPVLARTGLLQPAFQLSSEVPADPL